MRVLIVVCMLVACTNKHNGTTVDGPVGSACTGAVYDPCTSNDQCMSMNCHFYNASNLQVCTQACTAGDNSTCPVDSTGSNGLCNTMGNCKPAAANPCTR